jgi:glycosyltransferase involved in cell wall biosynthesis
MSKVSCIVSAYFAEPYLEGRLQNLMEQKPTPEIVIICQADSFEHFLVTDLCLKNPDAPIVLVTTPDVPTIYKAWNLGIKAASGEYITNSNCDDRLYPGALAHLAEALDKNGKKYAVAYSDADVVEQLGGLPVNRYEWAEGGIEELLTGCFLGPWPMWKKSLHDRHGYFDEAMHSAGDYEFWLRLAKAGEKFFHLRQVTGAYLKRPDSAEHRFSLRSIWEQARAKGRYREGVTKLWTRPEAMTD